MATLGHCANVSLCSIVWAEAETRQRLDLKGATPHPRGLAVV